MFRKNKENYELFSYNLVAYVVCSTKVRLEDIKVSSEHQFKVDREGNTRTKEMFFFIVKNNEEVDLAVTTWKLHPEDTMVNARQFSNVFNELKKMVNEKKCA